MNWLIKHISLLLLAYFIQLLLTLTSIIYRFCVGVDIATSFLH